MTAARVFVSCGQKFEDEQKIAQEIAKELRRAGFQPYMALEQQSLKGIKENIFDRLTNSEYFIFIDFKREKVKGAACRGSLFSHQELAIATYLGLEVLAFQEEGMIPGEGVLGSVQANPTSFCDRGLLPSAVVHTVTKARGWDPHWRNTLSLEREEGDHGDVFARSGELEARYFHIRVKNNNKRSLAKDCLVYLESICDLTKPGAIENELVEFKWKGLKVREAAIPPQSHRFLDAVRVNKKAAGKAWLAINQNIVDRKKLFDEYEIKDPGEYDLLFVAFSKNFEPARARFRLTVGECVEDTSLRLVDEIAESGEEI